MARDDTRQELLASAVTSLVEPARAPDLTSQRERLRETRP
jgi:hypothetical protein